MPVEETLDVKTYQASYVPFLGWDKPLLTKLFDLVRSLKDEPVTASQLYDEKRAKQLEQDKAKALSQGVDVEAIVKARNDRKALYNGNTRGGPKPPTELRLNQIQRHKPIEIKLDDHIPEIP